MSSDKNTSVSALKNYSYRMTHLVSRSKEFLTQISADKNKSKQLYLSNKLSTKSNTLAFFSMDDAASDSLLSSECKTQRFNSEMSYMANFQLTFKDGMPRSLALHCKDNKVIGAEISEQRQLKFFAQSIEKQTQIEPQALQEIQVAVSYPLMAYSGLSPHRKNIVIANLADKNFPQHLIHLKHQLICFCSPELQTNRILLLATDRCKLYVYQISLSYLFRQYQFGASEPIQMKEIHVIDPEKIAWGRVDFEFREIQRAEWFQRKISNDGIIVQTSNQIWFLNRVRARLICCDDNMVSLPIQRGSFDSFYWVKKSATGSEYFLEATRLWEPGQAAIYSSSIDRYQIPDVKFMKIEPFEKSSSNELIEIVKLLDTQDNWHVLQVNFSQSKIQQVREPKNISKSLQVSIKELDLNEEQRLDFDRKRNKYRLIADGNLIQICLNSALIYKDINTGSIQMIDTNQKEFMSCIKGSRKFRIESDWFIANSSRRVMDLNYDDGKKSVFLIYTAPNNRLRELTNKFDIIQQVHFISQDKLLCKMRQQMQEYWTILDINGQVQQPFSVKIDNFTAAKSFALKDGCNLIYFKNGEQIRIEKFNQRGEQIKLFKIKEQELLTQIKESITAAQIHNLNKKPDDFSLKSLKLSQNLICSNDGELFRIATVETYENNEQAQLLAACNVKLVQQRVKTIFCEHEYIKVIIFSCHSKKACKKFLRSSFVLCGGHQLCYWSPSHREVIKILCLKQVISLISLLKTSKANDRAIELTNKIAESLEGSESERAGSLLDSDTANHNAIIVEEKQQLFEVENTWLKKDEILQTREIDTTHFTLDSGSENSDGIILGFLQNPELAVAFQSNHSLQKESHGCCYLQVSLADKIFLYELNEQVPKEVFYINDTHFFSEPKNFVDLGFNTFWSKTVSKLDGDQNNWIKITPNNCKSSFIVTERESHEFKPHESIESKFKGILQSFSLMDLLGLKRVAQKLSKNASNKEMPFLLGRGQLESLLVTYRRHTVFSIFNEREEDIVKILEMLNRSLSAVEQQQEETDSAAMRRLYRILITKTPKLLEMKRVDRDERIMTEDSFQRAVRNMTKSAQIFLKDQDSNKSDLSSALQRSLFQSLNLRNNFFKLANWSTEMKISDFAKNQEQFGYLLKMQSSFLHEFLENRITFTPQSRQITNIQWPSGTIRKFQTFRKNTQTVGQKEIENLVLNKFLHNGFYLDDLQKTQVNVRILNIDWLLHSKHNFLQFGFILKKTKNNHIYQSEFLLALVEEFWTENFDKILHKCFLPWMMYMMCTIYFFSNVLEDSYEDSQDESDKVYKYLLGSINLLLVTYCISIQVPKLRGTTLKEYSTHHRNLRDIFQYTTTAWIVIDSLCRVEGSDKQNQRLVATFSNQCLWLKFFDWLRLFGPTSFYIKLVTATIQDLTSFSILAISCLAMIGTSMYMLQLSAPENIIIESITQNFFLDSLFNQYQLSLGEFQLDGFNGHPAKLLCFLFFTFSAFLSYIVFMNMLIAIMGNTFNFVIDRKSQFALLTKMSILSEYYNVVADSKPTQDFDNYLFVVSVKKDDDEQQIDDIDAWEGGFHYLRQVIDQKFLKIEKRETKNENEGFHQLNSKLEAMKKFVENKLDQQSEVLKYALDSSSSAEQISHEQHVQKFHEDIAQESDLKRSSRLDSIIKLDNQASLSSPNSNAELQQIKAQLETQQKVINEQFCTQKIDQRAHQDHLSTLVRSMQNQVNLQQTQQQHQINELQKTMQLLVHQMTMVSNNISSSQQHPQ